jgi:hypothetical protein
VMDPVPLSDASVEAPSLSALVFDVVASLSLFCRILSSCSLTMCGGNAPESSAAERRRISEL